MRENGSEQSIPAHSQQKLATSGMRDVRCNQTKNKINGVPKFIG